MIPAALGEIASSPLYAWVLLPALIIGARILDVSLGTLRVIFVLRGHLLLAPIVAFFEVLVWLLVIAQVLTRATNGWYYIAYATGYALGTWAGLTIERKLAIGSVIIRVITHRDPSAFIAALRERHFGLTSFDARGTMGTVQMIFTVVRRQDAPTVIALARGYHPNCFYSVEDVRAASDPLPPLLRRRDRLARLMKRR